MEYDYFGWLNSEPFLSDILLVAREIQQDLVAYNFNDNPREDLFGEMMLQLANRSQRILLGQERTPGWLSQKLVHGVSKSISETEDLQLYNLLKKNTITTSKINYRI